MPHLPYALERAIMRGHLRLALADLRWRWMQCHDPDLERKIAEAEAMLAQLDATNAVKE